MRYKVSGVASCALLVALAACSSGSSHPDKPTSAPSSKQSGPALGVVQSFWQPGAPVGQKPKAGSCHLRPSKTNSKQMLPDPRCTPGAAASDVTVFNTKKTACNADFAAKRKPAANAERAAAAAVLAAYGIEGKDATKYTVAFLVPLSLGGAFDYRNLWPVPVSGETKAAKARVDASIGSSLCKKGLGLQAAQTKIAIDWSKA